jgi:hypothetical protein
LSGARETAACEAGLGARLERDLSLRGASAGAPYSLKMSPVQAIRRIRVRRGIPRMDPFRLLIGSKWQWTVASSGIDIRHGALAASLVRRWCQYFRDSWSDRATPEQSTG